MEDYKRVFLYRIYPAFIEYVMDTVGIIKFNKMTKGQVLFSTKRGINPNIRIIFNKFLENNKAYLNLMSANKFEVFTPKNIAGGTLYPPIDCTDALTMIREGIHPPYLKLDKSVFVKSPSDREKVSDMKRTCGMIARKSAFTSKRNLPKGRLIVHLVNTDKKKDFKTTYNYICKEYEITDVLSALHEKDKVKSIKFNGREI